MTTGPYPADRDVQHPQRAHSARELVDQARYADAIASLDADVLALQEVDRDQPRSGGADLTAIAADAMGAVEHRFEPALQGTPRSTWVPATSDERPGGPAYGIALLSRYPVLALGRVPAAAD